MVSHCPKVPTQITVYIEYHIHRAIIQSHVCGPAWYEFSIINMVVGLLIIPQGKMVNQSSLEKCPLLMS